MKNKAVYKQPSIRLILSCENVFLASGFGIDQWDDQNDLY